MGRHNPVAPFQRHQIVEAAQSAASVSFIVLRVNSFQTFHVSLGIVVPFHLSTSHDVAPRLRRRTRAIENVLKDPLVE